MPCNFISSVIVTEVVWGGMYKVNTSPGNCIETIEFLCRCTIEQLPYKQNSNCSWLHLSQSFQSKMLNTEFLRHLISIAMETGYDPALIKVNVFRCNLWRFCENHKSFDKDNKIHLEHVVPIQNAFLHTVPTGLCFYFPDINYSITVQQKINPVVNSHH